jgi:hypothetical protein
MKALPPLGLAKQSLSTKIQDVRDSRFMRDRLSLSLLMAALAINLLNLVVLAVHVPANHPEVPLRYSTLGGFVGLGPWYSPFLIALFGLSITLVNGVVGYQAFTRSRLASFFLICGSAVVALFCLIISNAFIMVTQ